MTDAIDANAREMFRDQATADLFNLELAKRHAAEGRAAEWQAKYENLYPEADRLAGENNALLADVLRFSTELTRERARAAMLQLQVDAMRTRGISVLAQIIPGPALPEPGSIDAALAEQQRDPAHNQ